MQELIILFLIAFVIIASLLWKSSYSFDDPDVLEYNKNVENNERGLTNAMLYNLKYYEQPPVYLDPHFGSASGGDKINQFVIQ